VANKFGVSAAALRTWNGKVYDSRAECEYAQILAIKLQAGAILEVVEQPKVLLGEDTRYFADFLVIGKDEQFYIDVKGMETATFRKVKKLWVKYGRLPLHIIRKVRLEFVTSEIIQGPNQAG
jgi:hypothetical protein